MKQHIHMLPLIILAIIVWGWFIGLCIYSIKEKYREKTGYYKSEEWNIKVESQMKKWRKSCLKIY
jgi:hypothetical protein